MHQLRITLSFGASILIHVLLVAIASLGLDSQRNGAAAIIEAQLRAATDRIPVLDGDLLKNTLEDRKEKLTSPPPPGKTPGLVPAATLRSAREKLSTYQFYPPEAAARGIEGEVRLLLTLDGDGNVLDVRVAASSGFTILDEAAVRAATAMRSVPNANVLEMILPVVFRLE